ncbi:hypothetical protein VTN77DRAFT_9892 [Rasamsonia byssochlamydoides]|uniref:uncharacterized protein n=1 Tax=Rasamsonia byssochlamydoides TaxID=89139 RepID=UPI0037432337
MATLLSTIILISSLFIPSSLATTTVVVPSSVQPGPSVPQFVSNATGLDGPKVHPINGSAYDWWYFDAVAVDGLSSVVVVFYTAAEDGFPFPFSSGNSSVVLASLQGSFANGSLFEISVQATSGIIDTVGNGSRGQWENTGFAWSSNAQATEYKLTFDSADAGIKGSISLQSVAPAHYPCTPAHANSTLDILPGVGWANAVPDANAAIDLEIQGSSLQFQGVGYHDKNWGATPFIDAVATWYWGHGRLGPYSIVWYDALSRDGTEYTSSYVAEEGSIISAQCGGIKVRPTGFNSTYPPTPATGHPQGFQIDLDLGQLGTVTAEVVSRLVTVDSVEYTRWVGSISGVVGSRNLTGAASYETFNLEGL